MEKFVTTIYSSEEFHTIVKNTIKEVLKELDFAQLPINQPAEYMTQGETTKFLNISKPTLIKWKKDKKIPYYQTGRKILFNKYELLHVLKKNDELLK